MVLGIDGSGSTTGVKNVQDVAAAKNGTFLKTTNYASPERLPRLLLFTGH